MAGKEFFISGIDTDCGKTFITGLLAYQLNKSGKKVITTKLIQTGCKGISEDIIEHRRIMEIDILDEDKQALTCPFVYSYPASPHLAIAIDNGHFDVQIIRNNIKRLKENYEYVLSEGAGGLMVPITKNYTMLNYIKDHNLDLILVTSSKLGSINHTLLSIEACISNKIHLHAMFFNQMPEHDEKIAEDSFLFFKEYLSTNLPHTKLVHGNELNKNHDDKIATQGIFL